jgi:phospholipid transport system substrate-binding protein
MYKILLIIWLAIAPTLSFADSKTEKFVQAVSDTVISIIKNNSINDSQKTDQLKTMFIDTVDISWMAKFAMGKNWRSIDDNQKQKFIAIYQDFLLASYLPIFKKYTGEQILILRSENINEGQFKVYTKIDRANQEDINVDYVLHDKNGKLQVFDIVAENVSLIATQRSDFGAIFSQSGFEGIINALQSKIVDNNKK